MRICETEASFTESLPVLAEGVSALYCYCISQGAHSSAVEHYLDMVGVTGSIPVAPTNCFGSERCSFASLIYGLKRPTAKCLSLMNISQAIDQSSRVDARSVFHVEREIVTVTVP
jgi:hypothetical protein